MVLKLSGFADEAADGIDEQLACIKELGWSHIDLRKVDGSFVHDLPTADVERVAAACRDAGVTVASIGSAIANGGASIDDDESVAFEQTDRCVERMPVFGCTDVRLMSWKPGEDRSLDAPNAPERFRRLREIVSRFQAAGLRPLHENCYNYGGQSVAHTDRLLAEVPGLGLIFDNANPVATDDMAVAAEPRPKQSPWAFWCGVRDRVTQVHFKDAVFDESAGGMRHCLPGFGQGDVGAILSDLIARDYDGIVSIEPHLWGDVPPPGNGVTVGGDRRENWLAFGRRLQAIIEDLGGGIG